MSEIVFNSPTAEVSLVSQIESLQTTLASLNQQVISLQEALQERDQEILELKTQLMQHPIGNGQIFMPSDAVPTMDKKVDDTLTIVGALINLYKYIFSPRKDVTASTHT